MLSHRIRRTRQVLGYRLAQASLATVEVFKQSLRTTTASAKLAKAATQKLIEGEHKALRGLTSAEHALLVELLGKVAAQRVG